LALIAAVVAAGAAALGWRAFIRPDPDRVWGEAEMNLQAGRFAQARAGLERLERLRPATTRDWLLRAQLSSAEGRDDLALGALSHVPDGDSMAAQAAHMAGRIERKTNRVRFAEAAYRKAVALDPGMVRAHKELVYILGMQLRRHELDAEFKVLSRLTQLDYHDLFTWCLTHFSAWGPDIAKDLELFIAADPLDRNSRLALALLLCDEPATQSRVEEILEPLPPSDADAAAIRIEVKLNNGRIDEALAMLGDTPADDLRLERLRGRAALLKGDAAVAIGHFQKALSAEPYDRVSLAELGRALLLAGDNAGAEKCLSRVKRLDEVYNLVNQISNPDKEKQAPDLGRLGRACEAAGLLDEARGWYELAFQRDPLDSAARTALHRLGQRQAP
jgi:tetratricopeptide (TPR) repeat protein